MTPAANIAVANVAAKQDSNLKSAPARATHLCLVVHDDLELRLRLAGLGAPRRPALEAESLASPDWRIYPPSSCAPTAPS